MRRHAKVNCLKTGTTGRDCPPVGVAGSTSSHETKPSPVKVVALRKAEKAQRKLELALRQGERKSESTQSAQLLGNGSPYLMVRGTLLDIIQYDAAAMTGDGVHIAVISRRAASALAWWSTEFACEVPILQCGG